MFVKQIILAIIVLMAPLRAFAIIGFEDAIFPELITSGRALAMGNAFIAKVDDHHSVFYNPAGLGTYRGWKLHLLNFSLESNKQLMQMAGGGNITKGAENSMKAFNLDGVRQLLLENKGKLAHSRYHFFPNLTARYFSLGYFYSKQVRATIGTATNAKFEYAQRQDHGPALALNMSLFGGIIKFGGTALYLFRNEAIGESPQTTNIKLTSNDYKKGAAFQIIGGTRLTLPIVFLPTFAATIHNATGTKFQKIGGSGAPETIEQNLVLGFSLTPQIGKFVRVHTEINYKDAGDQSDVSATRRLGLGMEIDIARVMFMRLGYGDGFGSGGIGLMTKKLQVDISTYAVDTTSTEFRGKEDRRFIFSVSSGI